MILQRKENGVIEMKRRGSMVMEDTNEMKMEFDSYSSNESFARVAVAAFCTRLNPTLEELSDLKTAISEAITNCIIHAYDNQIRKIQIICRIKGQEVEVNIMIMWGKGSGRCGKSHGTAVYHPP